MTLPIACTCGSYYAKEDAALWEFCPFHGVEAQDAKPNKTTSTVPSLSLKEEPKPMRIHSNEYEAMDKAALHNALLALHTCPTCRNDLQPVAFSADVWGCAECRETWHLPEEK